MRIHSPSARSPITAREPVSRSSGIIANGMPRLRNTWTEDERPGRVDAEREDDDGRDERDDPPDQQRHPHLQQPGHDRRPRVAADRGRREPRREQADRRRRRRSTGPSAAMIAACAPSIVSVPSTPPQRRRREQEHRDVDRTGEDERRARRPAGWRGAACAMRPASSARAVAVAGERRVQVDRVRHDRRAEHARPRAAPSARRRSAGTSPPAAAPPVDRAHERVRRGSRPR